MTEPGTRGPGDSPVGDTAAARLLCPFDLSIDVIDRMLNFEIADDPYYKGLELQVFDDGVHGKGMVAFVLRREDGRADVYRQPGLMLDRTMFQVENGVGQWIETGIDPARLDITPTGVDAEVSFRDTAGRLIELRIDDRDGRRRRPGSLLAPFGVTVQHPVSLLLAYMRRFDLLRVTRGAPQIRIAGRPARTGSLPGAWLHHRRLVKYAAGMAVVRLNTAHDGPVATVDPAAPGVVKLDRAAGGIAAISAHQGDHLARLQLSPALPDLTLVPTGTTADGQWQLAIDGAHVVGGTWTFHRTGDEVHLGLDATRGWKPTHLPLLMRIVTTVMPFFRTWPTTYRWSGTVSLRTRPTMTSRWERKSARRGDSYRRLTGSGAGRPASTVGPPKEHYPASDTGRAGTSPTSWRAGRRR
jgi:hypothetical protein